MKRMRKSHDMGVKYNFVFGILGLMVAVFFMVAEVTIAGADVIITQSDDSTIVTGHC